jgi:hypothetical protein
VGSALDIVYNIPNLPDPYLCARLFSFIGSGLRAFRTVLAVDRVCLRLHGKEVRMISDRVKQAGRAFSACLLTISEHRGDVAEQHPRSRARELELAGSLRPVQKDRMGQFGDQPQKTLPVANIPRI